MALPVLPETLIYYNIEEFFDLSSIESMYRSDQDVDQSGITTLDKHSLTENDKQFFDLLLKRGASKAFEKLQVFQNREANTYFGEVEPDFQRSWGWNTLPEKTIAILNAITTPETNLHYKITEVGNLTTGDVDVVANDIVYFNGTIWVKDNAATIKYIFYYLQLPPHFDQNHNWTLDDKIKEFITLYVVREWFKRQRYQMDTILSEFEEVSNELGRIINYRRSISKTVRTF